MQECNIKIQILIFGNKEVVGLFQYLEVPTTYWHPYMSKVALYEFNNPDQLKIPLPHKHIASTFNDIMSKDVGYAYVSLLYACPLKTHSLRLNPFSK